MARRSLLVGVTDYYRVRFQQCIPLDVPTEKQCLSVNTLPAQKARLAEEVEVANEGNITVLAALLVIARTSH